MRDKFTTRYRDALSKIVRVITQVLFFTICGRDPAAFDESGNAQALSEQLNKISINEKVAILILNLYKNCTIRVPEKRESNFRVICDHLSNILGILRNVELNLSPDHFFRELRFSIEGLAKPNKKQCPPSHGFISFTSQSGRTSVELRVKSETGTQLGLEATIMPDDIIVHGASAPKARIAVNARIDASLSAYAHSNGLRRSAPKNAQYQSILTFDNISKNTEGLARCREILMRAIDCVERV